ncbi:squalene/phytoene synthase family protein [Cognatiyoonia sp. IB215182]|uniref:squalene/phytoene synthase family protein n=1 Tax=Cognatiyoonia sp. IB215182 TaxID=3097353 RepID=UPI002A11B69C|nr:squalene/phytoene synthase family protein [Cognatiyoonia sp. IB215182]MDX8353442.1 squalene/phytoene synthase family protein [Cognatiyoonia sp. IB215182]
MSLHACAQLVEKADPERFSATMAAPVSAREILFPLYAFNVEVSRAPWVTEEPMIAEMRLQWWRDALEEIANAGAVRKHEVVDALASVLDAEAARCLDLLVQARRWDIYKDAFEGPEHLDEYLDATSGHLMWTAARLLGPAEEKPVRKFAYAVGVANLFRAAPELEARSRKPLVDGTTNGVYALAKKGIAGLSYARGARRAVSHKASAALLSGYRAGPVLRQVYRDPAGVARGLPETNPLRDRLRLARVALQGWWV